MKLSLRRIRPLTPTLSPVPGERELLVPHLAEKKDLPPIPLAGEGWGEGHGLPRLR
jgi:hypothetical protein